MSTNETNNNETFEDGDLKMIDVPNLNKNDRNYIDKKQRRIRRNKIRRRVHAIQTIASIVVIVFLVVMIIGYVESERKYLKEEHDLNVEQVEKYEALLVTQDEIINEIQQDEWEVADDLYKSVKKVCKNSDDEVIKRLWEEKFPKDSTFKDDRAAGIVTIYALLDNHIEIRCEDNVLNALQSIDVVKLELKNAVDMYNTYYDFYSFWVDAWNNSSHTVRLEGKKENKFQPREINLTLNLMDQEMIDDIMKEEKSKGSDNTEESDDTSSIINNYPIAGASRFMVPNLNDN